VPPRRIDLPDALPEALGPTDIRWVGHNDLDLFVELPSDEHVRALRPNLDRLRELDARGLVVTAQSADPAYDFVSRYFAPRVGIAEDHATGSAHCGLGPY
jgi:predicted PhzF superfamily epimerase YddE/YHI9